MQGSRLLTLTFKKNVTATCAVAVDGVAARLEIRGLAPKQIRDLGQSIKSGPYDITLRHEMGDLVVGFVDHKHGQVRCHVLSAGKKLQLLIGIVDRREYCKDIRKSLLKELPMAFDTAATKRLKTIRGYLRKRAFGKALKALAKLRRRAHLRDYIALRRADIHMLAGRVPTAYVKYKNTQELMSTRSMRLLAHTRAAEVAYVVDHAVPPRLLIKSLQRPAPKLGQMARARLVQILVRLGKLEEALTLNRVQPNKATKRLNSRLLLALLRRNLRRGKAYEAALVYLRTRRQLPADAEKAEVLLQAGRAYMELDLPADAAKVLQQALVASKEARLRERVVSMLATAYRNSKQFYRARQTTDYYIASFKKGPRLDDMVEQRAGLKLREGDLKGAREDLARLKPHRAKALRKLLDLKSGKSDTGSAFKTLSRARTRQDDIQRKMEARR